jgi:ABC-type phosphate/phosphonate transport system permease subunit
VDTLGNLIQVLVHADNEHDSKASCNVSEAGANTPSWKLFRVMPGLLHRRRIGRDGATA